jgi:hypothetical protein
MAVLVSPIRMAGFRPYRSEKRPHWIPMKACERANVAEQRPAHLPTSAWGIWKDSIISGRYGSSDVLAMGSANRHNAVERSVGP